MGDGVPPVTPDEGDGRRPDRVQADLRITGKMTAGGDGSGAGEVARPGQVLRDGDSTVPRPRRPQPAQLTPQRPSPRPAADGAGSAGQSGEQDGENARQGGDGAVGAPGGQWWAGDTFGDQAGDGDGFGEDSSTPGGNGSQTSDGDGSQTDSPTLDVESGADPDQDSALDVFGDEPAAEHDPTDTAPVDSGEPDTATPPAGGRTSSVPAGAEPPSPPPPGDGGAGFAADSGAPAGAASTSAAARTRPAPTSTSLTPAASGAAQKGATQAASAAQAGQSAAAGAPGSPGVGTARRAATAAKAATDGEMMDAADEGTLIALEHGLNAAAPGAGTATVEILERAPGGRKATRVATYSIVAAVAIPAIAIATILFVILSAASGILTATNFGVAAACEPKTNNPVGNPSLDDPGSEETARYMWNQLLRNGFTKEAAAGVLGNVQTESSFNPQARNPSSGVYGLFQWGVTNNGARWPPLAEWARNNGYDPETVKGQMAMMLQEITVGGADTVYVGTREKTNAARTPEEGARLWHQHYERAPGQGDASRQSNARTWYDRYANAVTAAGGAAAFPTLTALTVVVPAAAEALLPAATQGAPGRTWPVPPDTPVTSGYKTPDRPTHDGTDFGYPAGLPIYAATDGVVQNLTDVNPGGYGYYVRIESPDGVMTEYGHLNANNIVPDGTRVKAGDVIGTSGDTYGTGSGIAHDNAPHLHFRVHVKGQSVDSIQWLAGANPPSGGTPAAGSSGDCGSGSGVPPSGGVNYSGAFVPGGLQLPVAEINQVSSRFGPRNFGGRGWENHRGMDFPGGAGGQAIRAVDGGIVTTQSVAESGGYGNVVIVDHGEGWKSLYAHMADVNVRTGQQVRGGDVLGTVGTTGDSTGHHLHFEIFKDGVQIDPAPFFTGLVFQPGA